MKLLILIGVFYLIWRALKSWMSQNTASEKAIFGKPTDEIDDIMVKDPFCEVYFPKRNGFSLKADGKELYFCSTQCRDKFISSRSPT